MNDRWLDNGIENGKQTRMLLPEDSDYSKADYIKIAQNDKAHVLIAGETGTGKDELAKALHRNSPRKDKPYIPLNAAAVTKTLFTSEMSGYEEGAHSTAYEAKAGILESADGCTLVLEEIGDVSPENQASLLRAIQEKEIRRAGSAKPKKIDVRIICTTNKDIDKPAVFRQDIKNRFQHILRMPPLRDRMGDVPSLLSYLITLLGRSHCYIEVSSLLIILAYEWPGNIRQLRRIVEHVIEVSNGIFNYSNLLKAFKMREKIADPLGNYKHVPDNLDSLLGAPVDCPLLHPSTIANYLLYKAEIRAKAFAGENYLLANTIPREWIKSVAVLNSIKTMGKRSPFFIDLNNYNEDKCFYPWKNLENTTPQSVISMLYRIAEYANLFVSMWPCEEYADDCPVYDFSRNDERLQEMSDKQPSAAFIKWIEDAVQSNPFPVLLPSEDKPLAELVKDSADSNSVVPPSTGKDGRGRHKGRLLPDETILKELKMAVQNKMSLLAFEKACKEKYGKKWSKNSTSLDTRLNNFVDAGLKKEAQELFKIIKQTAP
ncbi:MAG: hypothetical protein A2283_24255 [Lentisphaerae bacterium RIFOXYA12_FULL_48_11]|nr:MAG: hypothetical protein A2283_24255 [Lentisphaerae bacterium RIFOXYA12_FULL_48_11]